MTAVPSLERLLCHKPPFAEDTIQAQNCRWGRVKRGSWSVSRWTLPMTDAEWTKP